MLFNARAQLLGAITFSLLSQSCILLYQGDGSGAGGQGGAGGLGGGGLGGGAINAGGAGGAGGGEAGSGGAGGAPLCSDGAFPLVDVGFFAPGGDPLLATLQSLAPGDGDSVIAAGFSGNGFTPCIGDFVPPDAFFLLRLDESGGLGEPVVLDFAGAGGPPVISLARDDGGLLLAMSRPNGLKVQRLAPELSLGSELLTCQPASTNPMARITQGRVVANGPQLVVAAQLDADALYECTGAGLSDLRCILQPMAAAQAGSSRTLLWSPTMPPGTDACDRLTLIDPVGGELSFGSPRIALGAAPDAGATEVLLTARAGGSVEVHQVARLMLEAGVFSVPMRDDVGESLGLLLPAVLRGSAAGEKGVLGGVVRAVPSVDPPTPAVSVRFADNLNPISLNAGGPLVAAPASPTKTQIVAMDADSMQFLVVAQVDEAGADAFGSPGAPCAGPGLCGLWRTLDSSLTGGDFTLTTAGVYPSAGILIGPQEARNVVWAGQFEEGFSVDAASLAKPVNGPHTFIARQKL